ncbi:hypothetical protein Taro_015126, partial [Colocasia esculenta]|nr:hypothetical protein [Colocasia esculenta]
MLPESPALAATEEYVGAQTSDLSWLLTEILLLKAFLCKALKTSAAFTNLRIMDKLMLRFRMHLCGGGSARNAQVCRFFSAYGRVAMISSSYTKLQETLCCNNLSPFCKSRIPCLREWELQGCHALQLMACGSVMENDELVVDIEYSSISSVGGSGLGGGATGEARNEACKETLEEVMVDERRMKIVEMGGAQELLNMLEAAKDDRTRKAALKALDGLARSEGRSWALEDQPSNGEQMVGKVCACRWPLLSTKRKERSGRVQGMFPRGSLSDAQVRDLVDARSKLLGWLKTALHRRELMLDRDRALDLVSFSLSLFCR